MKNILLPAFIALIPFTANATTANPLPPKIGCAPREEIEKIIDEGDYEILFRGNSSEANKVTEVWFNGKGNTVSLNFAKPEKDDRTLIKIVCILDSTSKTTYNGDSVELLSKALDKVNPKL